MRSDWKKKVLVIILCMVMAISGTNFIFFAETGESANSDAVTAAEEILANVEGQAGNEAEGTATSKTLEEPSADEGTQLPEQPGEEPETPAENESPAEPQAPTADETAAESLNPSEGQEEEPDLSTEQGKDSEVSEEGENKPDHSQEQESESDVPEESQEIQQLTYKDDEVAITVSGVAKGAIPEGSGLQVTPIVKGDKETAGQYQEVETKLLEKAENEEYDIAGFLAYDICFVDAAGNKLEPSGEVKVTMEYNQAVTPEAEVETENTDVTIMHLEEDAKGQVKQVVDMTEEGKVTALDTTQKQEVQKTEFVTESFSTFVIAWTANYNAAKVTVHYVAVGESGQKVEITGPALKDVNDYAGVINLAEYVVPIQDYAFNRIETAEGTQISKIQKIKDLYGYSYVQCDSGSWNNGSWSSSGSSMANWFSLSSYTAQKDIYIVYTTEQGSVDGGTFGIPDHNKYIKYNPEAEDYTLTLDVTGKRGATVGVDVLLIIDKSGSMGSGTNSLMQKAKSAVSQITNDILKDSASVNKMAAISFSSKNYTENDISTSWVGYDQKSSLINEVGLLRSKGGTNWQLAMRNAEKKLQEVSSDGNQKVVIFMSDGDPGYYYYGYDGETGSGNSYNAKAYENAVSEVRNSTYLKGAKIYSVYLTGDTSTRMVSFASDLHTSGIDAEAVNGTDMTAALSEIAKKVVTPVYKDVTIEDTLSEYVDFAENTAFTVTCKRGEESLEILKENVDYTLDVNYRTKKVSLKLLNGNALDSGTVYSISFGIKPSEKAVVDYNKEGFKYPNKGDEGTDAPNNSTSSGKKGYYSNAEAIVRYRVNEGTPTSADYKKPVVQVDPLKDNDDSILREPAHYKKIKKNDDNSYTLSLDVKGEIGASSAVDVLLIIDVSNSMDESVGSTSRREIVNNAVTTLKDTLSKVKSVENGDLEINVTAVTFSGPTTSSSYDYSRQSCYYGTADAQWKTGRWQSLKDFSLSLSANDTNGGTNWQAGVRLGAEVLQDSERLNNKKCVIFITDGDPTFRYTTENGKLQTQGTGSSDPSSNNYNAAVLEWMKSSSLSAGSTAKYVIDTASNSKTSDFATAIGATFKQGTDKAGLENIFKNIASDIIRPAYTNVYIQDTLSDYVDFASTEIRDVGQGKLNFKVYRIDESGEETPLEKNDYTAALDPATKAIKVGLLNGNRLDDGVVYRIQYDVMLTEQAYAEYLQNGYGSTVGSVGTDAEDNKSETSSGKPGLRANSQAIVGYEVNGKEETAEYLHPVVQVLSVGHDVEKKWKGNKEESIVVQLKATAQKPDGTKVELTKSDYSPLPSDMTMNLNGGIEWKHTWEKLPRYYAYAENGQRYAVPITYTASENLSPSLEDKYSVEISESKDGLTTTITNTFSSNNWKMIKCSSTNEKLTLKGAKFELKQGDVSVATGESGENGEIIWTDQNGKEWKSVLGEYTIVETNSPVGYECNQEGWKVIFAFDSVTMIDNRAEEDDPKVIEPDKTGEIKIYLDNRPVYALPESGGQGIFWYIISATLLMMAGALVVYKIKCGEVLRS